MPLLIVEHRNGPASLPKIGARARAGQGCAVGPSHRSNYDIVSLMGAHSCGLTCNWVSSRGPRLCACARQCVLAMQCRAVGSGGMGAWRRTWQSSCVGTSTRASRASAGCRTGVGSSFTPAAPFTLPCSSRTAVPFLHRAAGKGGVWVGNIFCCVRPQNNTPPPSTEHTGARLGRMTASVKLVIYR